MTTTPQAKPDTEREAFGAWIAKDCGDLSTFGSGQNMHYLNSYVNQSWLGWKHRAALASQAEPSHEPNAKLMDLADRIDHEELWRRPGLEHRDWPQEKQDRMMAGEHPLQRFRQRSAKPSAECSNPRLRNRRTG